ncbi:MAG: VCBS repeat-containing protein, partial [Bacteroidota bacterium]
MSRSNARKSVERFPIRILLIFALVMGAGHLQGQSFTTVTAPALVGIENATVRWADIDNDGDLDLIAMGQDGLGSNKTAVYRNTGGNFSEITTGTIGALPNLEKGALAVGDYDNDGFIDLYYSGSTTSNTAQSFAFLNDGTGTGDFILDPTASSAIVPLFDASADWGDYDNDGDLDLLIAGRNPSNGINARTTVYTNLGNSVFIEDVFVASQLTDIHSGSVEWGDYDQDGDLDILMTGTDASGLSAMMSSAAFSIEARSSEQSRVQKIKALHD